MNRMLADAVIALNKLAAFLIIVVFMIVGWGYGNVAAHGVAPWPIVGGVAGAVVGVFAAGFVCGIVALLALIESHLRVLAERGKKPAPVVMPGASVRSAK